jgi:capsular polysaccharide transport system ATP-binding protein
MLLAASPSADPASADPMPSGLAGGEGGPVAMIEMKRASKQESAGVGQKRRIFHDLTFTLYQGERLGLFAVNGDDATTLLGCLSGVDQLDSGSLVQHGSVSWPVGTNLTFSGKLSGAANARFAAEIYSQPGCLDADLRLIQELAGIADAAFHEPISTWSGPMKDALKLAVSLAFEFDVLAVGRISGWDFRAIHPDSVRIRDLFERRIEGRTLVMAASGQNKLALEYCDEGVALVDGTLLYRGDPEVCLELVKEEAQRLKYERRQRVNARVQRLLGQDAVDPDDDDADEELLVEADQEPATRLQ